MLRIAVLQISTDAEQEELIKLTQPITEAYCRKHGYDYLHKKNTPLIAILSEQKNYDWIIHVEYNSLIKDKLKPLDDLLKLNRAIGINNLALAFNLNHPNWSDMNTPNVFALNCNGLLVETSLEEHLNVNADEPTTTRRPAMPNT